MKSVERLATNLKAVTSLSNYMLSSAASITMIFITKWTASKEGSKKVWISSYTIKKQLMVLKTQGVTQPVTSVLIERERGKFLWVDEQSIKDKY